MTVYYAPNQIQSQSGAFPAILATGDSWFWYPKISNLLAEISAAVKPDYSNIMALGYLGGRLEEYVKGKYLAAFRPTSGLPVDRSVEHVEEIRASRLRSAISDGHNLITDL